MPLLFAAGAIAARSQLGHAPATVRVDFAQPLPVVTAWGAFGERCFAILAATVAGAAAALLAMLRFAPKDAGPRARGLVVLTAAASLAAVAAWPFVFSSDAYAYAAYGEMAERGLDPYVRAPPAIHGPAIDAARLQWSGSYPVCVYGPAFVRLAAATWSLTKPFGLGVTLATLRGAAAAAFLGSIVLFDAALAGLAPRRRLRLLCAYGLHPVALWTVAEGHNDAFVLLAVAAAALAARRGAPFLTGAIAGLSGTLKASGAVLAAGFALDALLGRRRGSGALGATLGIATAAAFSVPPLLPALASLGTRGRYAPAISLQALVGLGPAFAAALVAGALGLLALRRRDRAGFAWLGLALVAALPNLYPWYALTLVPWALAAGATGPSAVLYAVTIFALIRYLPDAAGTMTSAGIRAATVVALLPLAAAVPGGLIVLLRSKKAVPVS